MKRVLRQRPSPIGLIDGVEHPVMARIYSARQIRCSSELELGLGRMLPPDGLSGVQRGVELLAEQVCRGGRVGLIGDFDADGATSCALGILALRAMGLENTFYLVPNRFAYGYGLTPPIVELAMRQAPDLLVTVDNGISSVEGVEAAHARGLQVVITDHHLPGPRLPAADAIINPNLAGDGFESKNLAGVGVTFYVLLALRSHLRKLGWFDDRRPEPNLAEFLDLVALGTVADVVSLDRNNRVLVEQGLRRIRAGHCRPGLTALLEVAGRDPRQAVASDLGYAVGPRLNAAGRLEDMSPGIECLLTDDAGVARRLAAELDGLNRQRREIEQQMESDALASLESVEKRWHKTPPAGLCLMDSDWHQGVTGILASRIRERFHRPVVVFAPAGDTLKGSARSIPGVHIRDLLERIATANPGLVARFGGHAAAAGLSLDLESFDAFRRAFEQTAADEVEPAMLEQVLLSDGPLDSSDLALNLASAIRRGGPWGQGFPEPLFDNVFEVVDKRIVGGRHLRLDLRLPGDPRSVEGIAFRALDLGWGEPGRRVRAAYRLDVNRWQGRERLQLVIEYLETLPG